MSVSLTVDLVEDSGLQVAYNGIAQTYSANRVINVKGLTANATAATALSVALQAIQKAYPAYSAYPGLTTGLFGSCVVLGHKIDPIRESDDAVKGRIIFGTPDVNGNATFIVSDSTYSERDVTQIFRDDITGVIQQILIQYTAPNVTPTGNNAGPPANVPQGAANLAGGALKVAAAISPNKQYVATVPFDKTMRKVVLDVIFPRKNLSIFRNAVNCVNDSPWNGLPRGFWRYTEFDSRTEDLGASYRTQFQLSADTRRDWSRYEALRDANTGKIITVDPNDLRKLQKQAYNYGVVGVNGLTRVGAYLPINFQSLFGNIPS